MSLASRTLCMLPLLLPFRAPLAFPCWRAPIMLSVLALPFLGLAIPVPVVAFALTASPAVPMALACVPSFACIFACLAAFLILPCPAICPAVVLFVIRATSAAVITFTTVPACSFLSFAVVFAFTFCWTMANISSWLTSFFVSSSSPCSLRSLVLKV